MPSSPGDLPEPNWLTLAALWRRLHDQSPEWVRLGHERHDARKAFLMCPGMPEDRAAYELEIAEIRRMALIVEERMRAGIAHDAAARKIIGFGRRAPDAAEEIIKPHLWAGFLEITDPERGVVSGAGLFFAGVRFAMWDDLSPAWRARVEEELQAAQIALAEEPQPIAQSGPVESASKSTNKAAAITADIERHLPELAALGSRNERARWLAKLGHNKDYARKILSAQWPDIRDRGKK